VIVADTSALVTLSAAGVLTIVLDEFGVHTTGVVVSELEETADYDDEHARAARDCLDRIDRIEVHEIDDSEDGGFESVRVDRGEGSCIRLAREAEAEFLLTDDLRALPELRALTEAQVAISPIVLRALIERGVLEPDEARRRLDAVAETRSWLGAPIYRRARSLLSTAGSD
jgi:predicted nucleic acid-binding protein